MMFGSGGQGELFAFGRGYSLGFSNMRQGDCWEPCMPMSHAALHHSAWGAVWCNMRAELLCDATRWGCLSLCVVKQQQQGPRAGLALPMLGRGCLACLCSSHTGDRFHGAVGCSLVVYEGP